MREIVVISGKGGAGKTSLTAAFAHMADNALLCDLDVDAPDLHILLEPHKLEQHEFWGGHEAVINPELCTNCGICTSLCRFDAIENKCGKPVVSSLHCEGCKTCVALCPENAIAFLPQQSGNWYTSTTRFGTMVHAQLFPGQENSGKLVSQLKSHARNLARKNGNTYLLADGSPGIGCPVISSLQGAHLAVIVTEPTLSGVHDFERVAKLCDFFKLRAGVIINKADLNPEQTARIKHLCTEKGYSHIADLPFDERITKAMLQRKTITEYSSPEQTRPYAEAWERITQLVQVPPSVKTIPFSSA